MARSRKTKRKQRSTGSRSDPGRSPAAPVLEPTRWPAVPTSSEWLAVVVLTLVAAALRLAFPSRMAVEHFDEGVYASNLWFADSGFRYPDAHLYAPPLVPWLIEWALVLFGERGWACMSVSLATGVATVPLLWWVGRTWFGVEAGLVAASLAAFSDVHVLYSRTALTDVPVGFWLVLAVFLTWEAFRRGSFLWAGLAGLATGVAWATKYTGWLPLAVGLSGWTAATLAAAVVRKTVRRRTGSVGKAVDAIGPPPGGPDAPRLPQSVARGLAVWAGLGGVAFLVWLPVLRGLQPHGGYAAVAANHKQYVVGLAGWWPSLARQWAAHEYLSGWLTATGFALATGLAVGWRRGRSTWNGQGRQSAEAPGAEQASSTPAVESVRFPGRAASPLPLSVLNTTAAAALAAAVSVWVGFGVTLAVLAAAGLLLVLLDASGLTTHHRGPRDRATDAGTASGPTEKAANPGVAADRWLAGWLLAAWWGGLLLAVPYYRPYPRLSLPWLLASWLAAGAAASSVAGRVKGGSSWTQLRSWLGRPAPAGGLLVASVLLLATAAPRLNAHGVAAWQDRTQYRQLAQQVVERARRFRRRAVAPGAVGDAAVEFVFYVYAEPALFFHLSVLNVVAQPVSDLDFASPSVEPLPVPVYLVAGPHALRSQRFAEQLSHYRQRFQLVARFAYRPSKLVLLNNYDARQLTGPREEEIRLYWLRPVGPSDVARETTAR